MTKDNQTIRRWPTLTGRRLIHPTRTGRRATGRVLHFAVLFLLAAFVAVPRAVASDPIRIVTFGDSLIAGYGVPAGKAFPNQLEQALRATYPDIEIINAGVSGDTSAAGLARFDWAIPAGVDGALVLFGGNELLRGIRPARLEKNLDAILARLDKRNIESLLLGMKAPSNAGSRYVTAFDRVYPTLATKHDTLLVDFFLEGVALNRQLNLPDGIHPNTAGIAEIVRRVKPTVVELIERIERRRSAGSDARTDEKDGATTSG